MSAPSNAIKIAMKGNYEYFTDRDFKTANPSCSIDDMDKAFMYRLDKAREFAGVPFIVNSAYRTVEHEHKMGRDGTSSHTKGLAVDISVTSSRNRYHILRGLLKVGFTRIGIGETFIHVDGDDDKAQKVIWDYYG